MGFLSAGRKNPTVGAISRRSGFRPSTPVQTLRIALDALRFGHASIKLFRFGLYRPSFIKASYPALIIYGSFMSNRFLLRDEAFCRRRQALRPGSGCNVVHSGDDVAGSLLPAVEPR